MIRINEGAIHGEHNITTTPQEFIQPTTVEEIQAALRDSSIYPGPVRAKGSDHSLTPYASTDGTMLDMPHMNPVIAIDTVNNTLPCSRNRGGE